MARAIVAKAREVRPHDYAEDWSIRIL